jgi:hypothetical protein
MNLYSSRKDCPPLVKSQQVVVSCNVPSERAGE